MFQRIKHFSIISTYPKQIWKYLNNSFFNAELLALRLTPNLEDQSSGPRVRQARSTNYLVPPLRGLLNNKNQKIVILKPDFITNHDINEPTE